MNGTLRDHLEMHALDLARAVWPEKPAPPVVRPNAKWHIVHFTGRSDEDALEWLKEFGFETYYPRIRELRRVPTRELSKRQRASGVEIMRPRLVAFMPRYAFARIDVHQPKLEEMFKFAGVAGMVVEAGQRVLVRDRELDDLRGRELEGAIPGKTPARLIFEIGEEVRVNSGPFHSYNGIVEQLPDVPIEEIDSHTRIRVAVQIFGRATPVDLEVSQVDKL